MTEQEEQLLRNYVKAVVKAPAHLHLTADRDEKQFWERHVLDAIKLLEAIPPSHQRAGLKVLDIGSGNGVPGIPLAILNPEWQVDLIDSDNKKCGFLDMFLNLSAIKNVRVICTRAENSASDNTETYDIVTARALGRLSTILELAAAFLKKGGLLIVPRGTSEEDEVKKTMRASEFLGYSPLSAVPYELGQSKFIFLLYKKIKDTPPGYPRQNGVPSKRPL